MVKAGIFGSGQLAINLEEAIIGTDDIILTGIFTTENSDKKRTAKGTPICSVGEISYFKNKLDVLFISTEDSAALTVYTPILSREFNVIDTFDIRGEISEHCEKTGAEARKNGKLAIVACGWDPGILSVERVMFSSFSESGNMRFFSDKYSQAVRNGLAEEKRQYDNFPNCTINESGYIMKDKFDTDLALILLSCARALKKLYDYGVRGCLTMPDIPPALYCKLTKRDIYDYLA